MKIQVGGLSEGLHRYQFDVPAADVDLGASFSGSVTVEAELDKTGSQMVLRAAVEAVGRFSCDRCLLSFDRPVRGNYRMVYVQEGVDPTGLDPSEMQVVPPSLSVIDVTDDVRQTVVLSMPLKNLCGEECRGLCPRCGTNLNLTRCACRDDSSDGRWDALRSLKTN